MKERLISIAIKRGDAIYKEWPPYGHKTIRESIEPSQLDGDIEGFTTNMGRFVNRTEAKAIALACGQLRRPMQRELLSSDIDWNGKVK